MTRRRTFTRIVSTAAAAVTAILLSSCSAPGADPFAAAGPAVSTETIVVGSQSYYSNAIIAEIYAEALESDGYTVDRKFNIGQRDAYIPALESGEVTLFPEYTGKLLSYYDRGTTLTTPDDVYASLVQKLPRGLSVLAQSSAADQDSYTVTKKFAENNGVTSIGDLAGLRPRPILGGPAEQATGLYGTSWLKEHYGVDADFVPIDDGGGPLTLKALKDDTIQIANIYTADPNIASSDLVILADPNNAFSASHVVPLINTAQATPKVVALLNRISATLTTADLIRMNGLSVNEQQSAPTIARAWIAANLR